MPPPSCSGIVDGGEDGAVTASALTGLARKGAVQIDHVQPGEAVLFARLSACAAGIGAIHRGLVSISPRFRRTQAPSFKSMAGYSVRRGRLRLIWCRRLK